MSGNTEGGGKQKKACIFCKIIVVESVIVLDPSRDTLKGKRGFSGGDHVELSWGLRTPGHPPAGAGAALSLLFLRVFQHVPVAGEDTIQQGPQSLSFHSLGRRGRAGFGRGKSRAVHSINPLAGSLPHLAHGDLLVTNTGGTRRNHLACSGLKLSSL